ncbi:phosphohydrolase [Bacillus sp. FJAT-18017]|uniref:HD domain-containing protein n=1 Tax=Bacillus sp. FJAT-18017 TaxID=1705566 RepID=UPI0006AFFAB4|nr:HD domain-containing protein [Bacillus sp. FJAT-18017]ALC92751.1 phosphohydrolase [Bacillus sp. FJAT-18017]
MIAKIEEFVKTEMGEDATGHDWHHVNRVRNNALLIAREEGIVDTAIIEMAALLHDIPDEKLNPSAEAGKEKLDAFFHKIGMSETEMHKINDIVYSISYKGGMGVPLPSLEARIVQDADRLDAIGAIGIARTFAYGGKKGQPIYDPDLLVREEMSLEEYRSGKSSTINHFYEKLLKLESLLNTDTAKKMAVSRQNAMEEFLKQFYREWESKL